MRTEHVLEAEVSGQRHVRLGPVGVGMQTDFLVLDEAPQPLDARVFDSAAPAVHIVYDAGIGQHLDPIVTGGLRSLVGDKDVGSTEFHQRLLCYVQKPAATVPPPTDRVAPLLRIRRFVALAAIEQAGAARPGLRRDFVEALACLGQSDKRDAPFLPRESDIMSPLP